MEYKHRSLSKTSAGDKDPKESVNDTGKGVMEKRQREYRGVFKEFCISKQRKTQFFNSRSSKGRQIDEMELENLKVKKDEEK